VTGTAAAAVLALLALVGAVVQGTWGAVCGREADMARDPEDRRRAILWAVGGSMVIGLAQIASGIWIWTQIR
jgi:hypothetical protein